jgi:hypothetical protein
MSKTLYEYAQAALAMGFHIFPLGEASKFTVTAHGFKDSETEPVVIRGWWAAHPGYNVGVDCGASVLAVVDIDSGLHSREEFDAWFAASGLPPTYTVRTGRRWEKISAPCGGGCKDANGTPRQINYVPWEKGSAPIATDDMWVPSVGKGNYTTVGRCEHCGWSGKIHSVEPKVPAYGAQLYYRGTMRSSGAGKFQLNGCTGEVKSIGGYVVGAGSIHPDSLEPYEVICGEPFAELPTLVGESVTKAKTTTSANGTVVTGTTGGKIQTGNRNTAAISCAGKLFHAGITAAPDLFLSLQAWSRSNCDPPLGDAELLDIATRAAATFEPAVDTTVSPDWTTPEQLAAETAELNELAGVPGKELWDAGRERLNEIRRGLEVVDGKQVRQARHFTDTAIFGYVAHLLVKEMGGRLFTDAYPFLFLPLETTIYDLHKDDAMYRILSRLGFLEEQKDYKLVKTNLFQHALYHGEQTRIEKFGCMRGDAIYVNNGRNGIIKITPDGFEEVPNGTDAVYMKNSHLTPWPALDKERLAGIEMRLGGRGGLVTGSKLSNYLNAPFEESSLTGHQYQQLIMLRYLSLFIGNALDLRPIMMAMGPQNSGKSTLWEKILWMFYGVNQESGGLPTTLRSFITAITNHQLQVFDNIDRADFGARSEQSQYIDPLCKCSTGGRLTIAQLYKNNVDKDYQLRCDVFLTSRTNPFPSQYTDLLRRTQIFPVQKPATPRTTASMKQEFMGMEEDLKLETLVRLQLVLRALIANQGKEWPPLSEMHPYETYTMQVADHEGWREEMENIWRGYYAEYQKQAAEDSPLVNFIRCWLGREGNIGRWARTGQIYKELEDNYGRKFTQFCRSDAAFGRRIKENYSAMAVLDPDKKSLDGCTEYRFSCSAPEQRKHCQNAYTDSLSRFARVEDDADKVNADPSLAWD